MTSNSKLDRFEKMMQDHQRTISGYKTAYKKYYGSEPNLEWNGSRITIEGCLTVSFKTLQDMTDRLLLIKPSFLWDWQKEDKIVHFNWFIRKLETTIDPECYAGMIPGEEFILAIENLKRNYDQLVAEKAEIRRILRNIIA